MPVSLETLATYPLFEGIGPTELGLMRGCLGMHPRSFSRGEVIYLMEERVAHVGVVVAGSVQMVSEDEDGERALLARMGPGELVGESFACGAQQDSSVTFVAGGKGARVVLLAFERVLHTCIHTCAFHQQLITNLITQVCGKNVRLIERIDASSRRTLREKVLAYLRRLARCQGSDVVSVPLNRTELAAYLSVNRSALSREIGSMVDDGIVEVAGDGFRLPRQRLRRPSHGQRAHGLT